MNNDQHLQRLVDRVQNPLYQYYNEEQVTDLYHQYYQPNYPYLEVLSEDEYGNPIEVIPNPYPWLEPCYECQGYWYIPGTNNEYACDEYGNVYSCLRGKDLAVHSNPRHYRYSVTRSLGSANQIMQHRLVAGMFIPEVYPFKELQVNHIDNSRANNHVSNLEWCRQTENLQHYYSNFHDRNWICIEIKNVHTGEIRIFPNRIAVAQFFGRSKDWVQYVIYQPDTRIWENGYQIRAMKYDNPPFPEYTVEQIEQILQSNGVANQTEIRNCLTGEILTFPQQSDACTHLGVSSPMLSQWLSIDGQPLRIINGQIYQAKTDSFTPWREVQDPYMDLALTGQYEPVKVIYPDGRFEIWLTAADCANAHGLLKTTLNQRINQANPSKFWNDGKAYVRYRDYPGF